MTQHVAQDPGFSLSWDPSIATWVVRCQAVGPQVQRMGFAYSLTLPLPISHL